MGELRDCKGGSTREYLGLKELSCILIVMVVKLHRLTT